MDYKDLADDDLVRECAENPCVEAWQEFIRRFNPQIGSVVRRACYEWGVIRPEIIEELVQETYLKLCANNYAALRRFKSRHANAFRGYLKVLTVNLVFDYFRHIREEMERTGELNPAINPGNSGSQSTEKEIFFKQVDKILRQRGNGPREQKERAIFWLYYRHGLTCKEIASIPAMHLGVEGVESCIFRLIAYLKKKLEGGIGENQGGILPEGSF